MSGILDAIIRGWIEGDRSSQALDKDKENAESGSDSATLPAGAVATKEQPLPDEEGVEAEEDPILPAEDSLIVMSIGTSSSSYSHLASTPSPASQNAHSDSESSPATHSTPGMDISFGPQSPTFVVRRRALPVDVTPARVPQNSPASFVGQRHQSIPIVIRHPDGRSVETIDPVSESTLAPMTAWRQEQIKNAPRARVVNEKDKKPIPIFHGPLSLPYARNPSGVDAILADDSKYLNQVFDLRRANAPRMQPTAAQYVPSPLAPKPAGDAMDSKAMNAPAGPHETPVKPVDVKSEAAGIQADVVQPSKVIAQQAVSGDMSVKDDSEPATSILRSQVPGTTAPSLASPDAFTLLFNQAIANAARDQSTGDVDLPSLARAAIEMRQPAYTQATYRDLLAVWKASNEAYERLPEDPTPLVAPRRVVVDGSVAYTHSTPVRQIRPETGVVVAADKGMKTPDWRKKAGQHDLVDTPEIVTAEQNPVVESDTMTMDQLFDHFTADSKGPTSSKVTFKSPSVITEPASKGSGSIPAEPALKSAKSGRSPLGSASHSMLNASPMRLRSRSIKGTPGAGKHLKSKAEPVTPVEANTKTKAV